MLNAPMSRRSRTRSRSRRTPDVARRVATPRREDEVSPARPSGYRARGSVTRSGFARAAGLPSPTLERAASLERAFIEKDFRRLGITVAVALGVLILAGLAESTLLPR